MSAGEGQMSVNEREIWRERPGDYYADSIYVVDGTSSIGINCGGYVYVKPVREWYKLARREPFLSSQEGKDQTAAIPPRSGGAEPNSAGLEARTGGSAATYGTLDNPIKVCRECRCHPCKCADPSQAPDDDLVLEFHKLCEQEGEVQFCAHLFQWAARASDRIVEQGKIIEDNRYLDKALMDRRIIGLIAERDSLRAQLAERDAEIKALELAYAQAAGDKEYGN